MGKPCESSTQLTIYQKEVVRNYRGTPAAAPQSAIGEQGSRGSWGYHSVWLGTKRLVKNLSLRTDERGCPNLNGHAERGQILPFCCLVFYLGLQQIR